MLSTKQANQFDRIEPAQNQANTRIVCEKEPAGERPPVWFTDYYQFCDWQLVLHNGNVFSNDFVVKRQLGGHTRIDTVVELIVFVCLFVDNRIVGIDLVIGEE